MRESFEAYFLAILYESSVEPSSMIMISRLQ